MWIPWGDMILKSVLATGLVGGGMVSLFPCKRRFSLHDTSSLRTLSSAALCAWGPSRESTLFSASIGASTTQLVGCFQNIPTNNNDSRAVAASFKQMVHVGSVLLKSCSRRMTWVFLIDTLWARYRFGALIGDDGNVMSAEKRINSTCTSISVCPYTTF